VRDGDTVEVVVDRRGLTGTVALVATAEDGELSPEAAARVLASRAPHPDLRPHPGLPADTRLWAALQDASGGTWAGAVYDVDKILERLAAGRG